MDTEAVDALTAVGIERPDRNAFYTGEAGKEAGEGGETILIADNELITYKRKLVFRHRETPFDGLYANILLKLY